jgi:hypothetical protein
MAKAPTPAPALPSEPADLGLVGARAALVGLNTMHRSRLARLWDMNRNPDAHNRRPGLCLLSDTGPCYVHNCDALASVAFEFADSAVAAEQAATFRDQWPLLADTIHAPGDRRVVVAAKGVAPLCEFAIDLRGYNGRMQLLRRAALHARAWGAVGFVFPFGPGGPGEVERPGDVVPAVGLADWGVPYRLQPLASRDEPAIAVRPEDIAAAPFAARRWLYVAGRAPPWGIQIGQMSWVVGLETHHAIADAGIDALPIVVIEGRADGGTRTWGAPARDPPARPLLRSVAGGGTLAVPVFAAGDPLLGPPPGDMVGNRLPEPLYDRIAHAGRDERGYPYRIARAWLLRLFVPPYLCAAVTALLDDAAASGAIPAGTLIPTAFVRAWLLPIVTEEAARAERERARMP